MPTKIQGGLGIDKVQDGTVGLSDCDTELYGKITALTTINLGEAKAASGTFVDFDVPVGVKRVTVMFDGVSTNGTSHWLIRIGSNLIEASGYTSISTYTGGEIVPNGVADLSGFVVFCNVATHKIYGSLHINNLKDTTFVSDGMFSIMATDSKRYTIQSGGSKTLSGPLTKLRITTVNGTNTFDAGIINISWEF